MNRNHESPLSRSYTEDELVGLMATYFGDKLSQTQLDSLVAAVAAAHADRHDRTAERQEGPGTHSRAPTSDP